ncbi:MAG: beta-N-acetylhexosaminidase [Pseudomonadota bacterium]
MPIAAIFDCEGPRLSDEERAFFRDADPWGFIVFARHCASAEALRAHCDELRECVGRADAPILIDQEGGRVARMRPPVFPAHPAPAVFGELLKLDPKKAGEASYLNGYLLGRLVSDHGVTVNCMPMLDVPQPDADPSVIGDRAYAKNAGDIERLARRAMEGLMDGGALPVIKHLPGHGRALCDSHLELPRVGARRDDLAAVDFSPFCGFRDAPMAMTAHVLYEDIDPDEPATTSKTVIDRIIRGDIGFDGLLMSDDLKMKALGGSLAQRAEKALAAGCDIALCCNYDLEEKTAAAAVVPALEGAAATRAQSALAAARQADDRETAPLYEELANLLKPVLVA